MDPDSLKAIEDGRAIMAGKRRTLSLNFLSRMMRENSEIFAEILLDNIGSEDFRLSKLLRLLREAKEIATAREFAENLSPDLAEMVRQILKEKAKG